jgi:DNA-binding NtrC family response regulator
MARTLLGESQEEMLKKARGDEMDGKSKILVVDDEEVVRLSHLRLLTKADCNVEAVWNGTDALREMERDSFDLVLLDLRMPGLDGMSVLRMIKQRWPESEVVVITGYPSVETAKEAIRLGAYDYLAKPVDPDQVIKVANCAITKKKWSLHRVENRLA